MLVHGIVSAGLFFGVGTVYDRHHTRLLRYYRGLATTMPLAASFFLLFTLANMGFPLTANFIGEVILLAGLAIKSVSGTSRTTLFLAATGIVFSAIYSI